MRPLFVATACLLLASTAIAQDAKIARLIEDLDSVYKAKRMEATRELGYRSAAAADAIPFLAKQLRRKDDDEANLAGRALAQIGPAAVGVVVKALEDEAPAVRNRALLTLGTMGRDGGKGCLPVAKFLRHEDAKARLLAALVLGAMHQEAGPAAPLLEAALSDKDLKVRFVAADSLFQIGLAGVPHLVTAAKDGDADARFKAVATLGRYQDSDEALQALAEALKDREARIRAAAAGALIRSGASGKAAVPALLDLLKDGDQEMQAAALAALGAIRTTKDTKLHEALVAANEHVWGPRHVWVSGDLGRFPALKALASSAEPTQKLAGALALAQIGPKAKALLPLLKGLLADKDRSLRAAAFLAIAVIEGQGKGSFEKAADLFEDALERQRGSSDLGELIRLHMVISELPALTSPGDRPAGKAKERIEACAQEVRKRLEEREISFEQFPALVEAMNLTAQWNFGFTEPFNSLVAKVEATVEDSKDPRVAIFVYKTLGRVVSADSLYWPAFLKLWSQGLARVPLEFLEAERRQILAVKERREGLRRLLTTEFS